MEESLSASLLVLAGLLRLAGVSQSEPWSSHPADRAFLEEGLVTTKTHLASGTDATEATFQLDHVASTFDDKDVSYLHEASEMQAEGVTEDKDPLLTILATAGQTDRSEQSLGAAIAGQHDALSSSKPLTGMSALTSVSESKAESSSLSQHSAKFLPGEEGAGNSTAGELMSLEGSTPFPSKASVVDPLATHPLSSESARQQVISSTTTSPTAATGNLHRSTWITNSTEAEPPTGRIRQTSAKESVENLPTLIPKSSQYSQGKNQSMKPNTSSGVFRTADLLAPTQSPVLKIRFPTISPQTLLEGHPAVIPGTKMAQRNPFASSPQGETKEHRLTEQGKTENPTPLADSQSNTHSLPSVSTPGTLSLKASPQSGFTGDLHQSRLSKLVFSSQFPSFSKSATSTKPEKHIREYRNMTLHHEMDRQPATQTSLFRLSQEAAALSGLLLPGSQRTETTADSMLQPSSVLPPVHGTSQGRVANMTPVANLTSSHVIPTVLAKAAPSKIGSLVPSAAAAAAGDILQAPSDVQLPPTPSSVFGEQLFPSTSVPSLIDPEPVVVSSSPVPTKQQTPVIHSGPTPPHAEPVGISGLARTKAPSRGPSASGQAGLSTSSVSESAPSRLKPPALSTVADDGLQESMFGLHVAYQAEQRMLGDSAPTHAKSTAPVTSPSHVQTHVPVVPRLNVLRTSVQTHLREKLSTDVPFPLHAKTPSLLAQVYAKSMPPATPVPPASIPAKNAPPHVKSQVPGSASSFIDDSRLLVTSVPGHAKPKMNEAPVQSRLVASTVMNTPPRTGVPVSTHTKVQSLTFSAPTEHPLSDVSAELGARLHNETEAPKSSSPLVHHQLADIASHGQPSSMSVFVDTSHQPQETPTSANTGTETPSTPTHVHPSLQLHATTLVLSGVAPQTPVKVNEDKNIPQSSPPTSQTGTNQVALVGTLKRSSPMLGSPGSQVSHRNEVKPPFMNRTLVEESAPGLRTTPVLAAPDVQDLMYSSLDFIQSLNRSDVPASRSLDTPAAGEYLGVPPSLHYLSVLVRNAENMVCLKPVQDATTPPSGPPNASGQGVASAHEMLFLSSSLGFPHLGASGLAQMSPSSVILVKPVLVFLPVDKPEVSTLSSAEEEDREHQTSLPFTNKTVWGFVTLGGSQEQPMETSPSLNPIRNSTEKQAISGPVLKAIAGASWVRSSSVTTIPSHYGLKVLSTRTQSLNSKNQDEGFPSSGFASQELEGNSPVWLPVGTYVEHQVPVTPVAPEVVSLQQRSNSPPATTSLHSLMASSASQRLTWSLPTSRTVESPQQGLQKLATLHTETPPHGSLAAFGPVIKNTGRPLRASLVGNMELPLDTEQEFTLSRPTFLGSSSTNLMGKLQGREQSVASVGSGFLEEKLKVSEILNFSHSAAILQMPLATEMPTDQVETTFPRPSKHHPKTSTGNERLRSSPVSSAHTGIQATGNWLESLRYHQVVSRPPAEVPSHLPASSYLAKPAPKHNLTTLVVSGRATPAYVEDLIEQAEFAEETNESVRVTETHHQTEATSTMAGRDPDPLPTLLVVAELNALASSSHGTRQAGGVQKGVHKISPAPVPWLAPNASRKDLAVSPMGGKTSLLETADLYRLDPTASGTSKEHGTPLKHRGAEHGRIAAHSPVPASLSPQPVSLEGDHLERPRLLGDDQAQKAASSLPRPGGTSSSVLSFLLSASTILITTLSSGAGADRAGWISNQTPLLQTLPLDASETFLNLHTQIQPTSEATAEQVLLGDVTGELEGSHLYTMGEQVLGRTDATDGAEDLVTALQPEDLDGEVHHRRLLRSDDVFLDGFAVVSDDSCSSGNYTTEMSLRPGVTASSPDSFLALIIMQDNSSQATLRIESCCVTPTSRPAGPEAACCLFPRSPLECGHIQFHQNGQSGKASFSIQLFQMLNHSMVYLHCELSVCLSKQGGCKQGCLGSKEALSRMSNRSSYQTRHNLISVGPVWKAQTELPSESAAEPDMAMMLPFLLGSLTGTALIMGITVFIWLRRKCKTKMADSMESQGGCAP